MDAVVISDVHLGAPACRADLLYKFLRGIKPKTLVINGDLMDSWDGLTKYHWHPLVVLRELSAVMQVVWVHGNHDVPDDLYVSLAGMIGVEVCEKYVLESGGRRVLFLHGHQYDDFLREHPHLTDLGDWVYKALQRISLRLASYAKRTNKTMIRCVERVKAGALLAMAAEKCDAVACGHTHVADPGPVYFNSGSWVSESPTYLAIDNGVVILKHYIPSM